MDELHLKAERRSLLGKQVKHLRRAGRVPGIVYGPMVTTTVPVTVDRREFDRHYQGAGRSTLFTLRWEDGQASVLIRDVQQDPIKQAPLHVDFYAPNLTRDVTALVPLVFHHPQAIADGVLTHLRTELEVRGLPAAIPHQIDVDIAGLVQPGDALHARDLTMPTGVEATTPDELIVHVTGGTPAEEVAEGAAAAEEPEQPAAPPATEVGASTSGTAVEDTTT